MSSNTSEATQTAQQQQPQENQTATSEAQGQTATTQQQQQGTPDVAEMTGSTDPHADDDERMRTQPKPDVSDQDYKELLPKLFSYFHNNREELARALGVHRSTVDRWMNNTSRPNNSTVLRMRRVAQERRIE